MADYISNYTGAEIDDAVGKASTIPQFTQSDANKVLTVNSTGNGFKYTTPASGGNNLPQMNTNTEHLVLTNSYDSDSGEFTARWDGLAVPSPEEEDRDKALILNSSGELAWSDYIYVPNWDSSDRAKALSIFNSGSEQYPDWELGWVRMPVIENYDGIEPVNKVGKFLTVAQSSHTAWNGNTYYTYDFDWATPNSLPSYNVNNVNGVLTIESVEHYDSNTHQTSYTYEPHWVEIIPSYNFNDAGKILSVWACGGSSCLVWRNPSDVMDILPTWDSNDADKVLQISCSESDGEYTYFMSWNRLEGLIPPSGISGMGLVIEEGSCIDVVDPTYYIPMWLSQAWAGEDHLYNVNSFLAVVPSGPNNTSLTWVEGQIAPLATASDLGKVLKVVSHTDEYDNTSYMPSWENISSILPSFTASDYGKTLSINWTGNGIKWADSLESILENMPSGSDIGNVLYVIDCGGEPRLRWAEPNGYVFPDYSVSDIGKTLTIVSDGYSGCQLAWV